MTPRDALDALRALTARAFTRRALDVQLVELHQDDWSQGYIATVTYSIGKNTRQVHWRLDAHELREHTATAMAHLERAADGMARLVFEEIAPPGRLVTGAPTVWANKLLEAFQERSSFEVFLPGGKELQPPPPPPPRTEHVELELEGAPATPTAPSVPKLDL